MKNKATRTMILAAMAMTGAVAVHGQTRVAAAEVEFGFQAGGVQFQAGTYRLSEYPVPDIFTFENAGSGHKKFVNTMAPGNQTTDRNARLVFRCTEESGCALSKIVLSDGRQWKVRTPWVNRSEMARTEVVRLGNKQVE
jgi:hypothetical protein